MPLLLSRRLSQSLAVLPLLLLMGSPAEPASAQEPTSYRVQLGDTLWGIARKNGLSLPQLIAVNPQIPDPDLILIGQPILLSSEATSTTTVAPPVSTARATAPQKKDAPLRPKRHTPVRKPKAPTSARKATVAKTQTPERRANTPSPPRQTTAQIEPPKRANPYQPPRPTYLALKLPPMSLTGNRQGAAKRGPGCTTPRNSLTAILPNSNLGLVVSEQPSFYWYMPTVETSTPTEIEFILSGVDSERRDIDPPLYMARFSAAGLSGVSSLTVPPDQTPLVIDADYRWSLSIICDPEDRSRDEAVSGWIRRIAPEASLAAKLEQARPEDYPALYAEAGLWFDALRYLAALRRNSPDANLANDWSALLKTVGLEQVADKPLTCVAPSTNTGVQCPSAVPSELPGQ